MDDDEHAVLRLHNPDLEQFAAASGSNDHRQTVLEAKCIDVIAETVQDVGISVASFEGTECDDDVSHDYRLT